MSFPKYEKYKDSEVEWLGEVPKHWDVCRLKFLADIQTGDKDTVDAEEDGQYPFFVRSQTVERINTSTYDCEAILTAGDGVGVGKVFHHYIGPFDFHQRVYMLNEFRKVYGRFLFHYMRANFYKVALEGGAKSTVDSIRRPMIADFPISLPSPEEQTTIANFLDAETAKLDALIAEQGRLIELLREKRQAVISHAVTKGLNPTAPLKPSNIPWLGDVPEHWSVSSLRHFASFCTGSTPARDNPDFWNGDILWVKTGEIKYEQITETEEKITQLGLDSSSCSIAPAGTLLMALYGQGVTRGRVAILGVAAAFNQACVAITVDERINNEFLHTFFVFAYPYIRDIGNETTQMNMNVEFVRRIMVVVPPIDEQLAVTNHVRAESKKFDSLITEAERSIELLQERRTALISAAVTGKIDVREFAG